MKAYRSYRSTTDNHPDYLFLLIIVLWAIDVLILEYDQRYHILMLYYKEGINYPNGPYVVGNRPELRDAFKAVGLIAINSLTVKQASGAIRDELKDRKILLPAFDQPIKTMVEMFQRALKPIEKHLFSDAGIWLQNVTPETMNRFNLRQNRSSLTPGDGIFDWPIDPGIQD